MNDIDPILEGLTTNQLKDTIAHLSKDIFRVKAEAKDFAKASRATVKEKEERIKECLELIEQKKTLEVNG